MALPIFTESAIFTTTVNKAPIVKIEGPFEKAALRILRDIPDIAVEAEARLPDGKRADFLIRVRAPAAQSGTRARRR